MKYLLRFFIVFFVFCNSAAAIQTEKSNFNQTAQTVLKTIDELENSGYITSKNALDAKEEFVFSKSEYLEKKDKEDISETEITWTEYLTLTNIMKLIAIICLVIAFRGLIFVFIGIFKSIPTLIYQSVLLTISLCLTFFSEMIWFEEALYISIFGVISNIIILGWMALTYADVIDKIIKYFNLGIDPNIVCSAYLTIYFGLFAIFLDSWFLGIIATITFVGMFTFTMESTGITTFIGYEKEEYTMPGLIISLLIVTIYSFIVINGIDIQYLDIFSPGIEYVLTIVLTITLLVLTSSFYNDDRNFWLNVIIFVSLFIGANTAMILFNLEVIPAIINTGFVLFILGWMHYFTYKVSGILTMFLTAITLYFGAIMLETYPQYFVTSLM